MAGWIHKLILVFLLASFLAYLCKQIVTSYTRERLIQRRIQETFRVTHVWGAYLPRAICCHGSAGCALDRIVECGRGHQIWQGLGKGPRVMSGGWREAAANVLRGCDWLCGTHRRGCGPHGARDVSENTQSNVSYLETSGLNCLG